MEAEDSNIGKKVRIILTNNFHFSGTITNEDSISITIKDKFNMKVKLAKDSIMLMEISQ